MTTEMTALAQTPPWTADDRTFGARLALVRQHMGWGNVKEAAKQCAQPAESWRRWERDGIVPRNIVTVAKQIAGASGCDYLWLLVGPDGIDRRLPASGHRTPRVVKTIDPFGGVALEQTDRIHHRPVVLHHPNPRASRPLTPTAA